MEARATKKRIGSKNKIKDNNLPSLVRSSRGGGYTEWWAVWIVEARGTVAAFANRSLPISLTTHGS
jgi:hypothetical protein